METELQMSDVTFQVFYKTDPMSIKITQLRPAPGHLNNEIQPAAALQCTSNQEKNKMTQSFITFD